ncbi:MAG: hypothetical protein M3161_07660, partial [Actinomycetota bacterium]|nr:hypothetical protein [Actinomycetota bacterium]
MNDFERVLSESLKQASDTYRPSDPYRAKERFLQRARRRRLVLASGGVALAGAAAAAAFVFFAGEGIAPRRAEPLPPAAHLEEVSEIAVGERPTGVAFGDGLAWVANAGDGTVMTIDPDTRTVEDTFVVGGDPDDVAVGAGAAWVSDSGAGTVTSLTLPSAEVQNDPVTINVGAAGSTHMDIAPGANALWVAKDDALWRIDPMSLEPQQIPSVEAATDVAVGEDSVYVLGARELARVDPATYDVTNITTITESRNQDLAFREGYLWLADGDSGEVTRIDPATGERSPAIFVGGSFSGIAVDAEAVWVISGGAGDTGVLTRIDPDTLAPVLPRAELSGRPYDITLGAERVWVANQSAGTVTAIDPADLNGKPESPPSDSPLVFAFGGDGDIWGALQNGDLVVLSDHSAAERNPTLSEDGRYVAFERGAERRNVVVRDLETGEDAVVGEGHYPAFGPDGRLAYVGPSLDPAEIVVGRVEPDLTFVEDTRFEPIADYPGPNDVWRLEWDLEGDYLYYTSGWEESLLMQADPDGGMEPFELIPGNATAGSDYLVPSVRASGSVHVMRVCCSEHIADPHETAELGMIRFTEGGPQYEPVVS